MPFEQLPHQPQYVSSRVCTPAPEAIDPFLEVSTHAPAIADMGSHGRGAFGGQQNNTSVAESVVIRMGVQELRELIAEAVQKALGGLQGEKSVADVGLVAQGQVDEVVASGQNDQSAVDMNEVVVNNGGEEVLAAMAASTDDVIDVKTGDGLQPTEELARME